MQSFDEIISKIIFWELHDFYCVIRPFQHLMQFFGFGLIKDFRKPETPGHMFITRWLFTLIWIVFLIVMICINLRTDFFGNMSPSVIANAGRRIALFMGLAIALVTIILSYMVADRCTEFLKKIISFDDQLKTMGFESDLKKEFVYVNSFMLLSMAVNWTTIILSAIYHDKCETQLVCFYAHVPLYFTSVVYLSFSNHFQLFMFAVIYRFKKLDKYFVQMVAITQIFPRETNKKDRLIESPSFILKFAELHDKLVACVDDINYCFSVPCMFATGATFGLTVTTFFVLFRLYVFGDMSMQHITEYFSLWVVFFSIPVYTFIIEGSKITSSGKSIATLIHRTLHKCPDPQTKEDLKIFSQQLVHREPIITCGLFPFDWTLLYSLASAITTYLVILIQFDASIGQSSSNSTQSTA